jgi:hypothetical protein
MPRLNLWLPEWSVIQALSVYESDISATLFWSSLLMNWPFTSRALGSREISTMVRYEQTITRRGGEEDLAN